VIHCVQDSQVNLHSLLVVGSDVYDFVLCSRGIRLKGGKDASKYNNHQWGK